MKSSTIIFLLVLFVCCGANNFLRVIGNDYSEQILWEKPRNPSVHPFPITSEAALGGDQGILYQSKKENDYRLEARGPFFKENWITFLVYVDHWTFPSNSADTHYLHNFMNLSIGEPIKNKQPSVFLQGKLYSSGDTIYLNIRSHFSINTADIHEINIPISLKTIHIVEICLSSGNSDAMGLSMFVDKEQKYVIWKKYPFAKDFTEIN
ncbi:MAG: hypothetical protein JNL74_10865, partial [Fibrobacteres bacterium]|nr:hypothetical protein [Fibrobacterota bacterium]